MHTLAVTLPSIADILPSVKGVLPSTMRYILPKLFVGLVLTGCSLVANPGGAASLAGFEAQLEDIRTDHKIPGMSAVIAHGQRIVWSRGFGFADVEHRIAATDTTVYPLASLTKTFASTIVMQLVEAGKLDLDAPVTNFGIELPSSGIIRVKHLFSHTSEGEPGASYSYNGSRYARLDQVIRRTTGESFGQRLMRDIVTPLQLTHTAPNTLDTTNFKWARRDRATFEQNLALGYEPDGTTRVGYPPTFSSSAGLLSSAVDVARYSMAIDRNAFLKPETQARAFTATVSNSGETLPYGLGWFISDIRGVRLQWHYGYWTGHSAMLIRVPARNLVFVLLANSDMLSRNTRLGSGDLMSSPAARAFLETFVFGDTPLPQ